MRRLLDWIAGRALLGTNLLGLLLFAAAFGPLVFAVADSGQLIEALLTVGGGLICCVLDLGYRAALKHETLIEPNGPQVIFLPGWLIGGVWVVVGIVKTILAVIEQSGENA